MDKNNNQLYSWVILICLALIWGTSFILIKKSLEVFQPQQIGALRVVLAFVFLSGLAVFHLKHIPRNKYKFLFISGMLGFAIPAFLFPIAQTQISSSVAGILNALTPFFTLLTGLLFFNQKTNWVKVVGLLIGLVGAMMIAFIGAKGGFNFNFYVIFIVLATICYAVNVNLVKVYLNDLKSLHVSTLSIFLVAPFMFFYLLTTDVQTTYSQNEGSLQALVYLTLLAFFSTALASVFYFKLIKISSPVFASSVTYVMPVVALMWGLIDGEELVAGQYAGMVIIIFGVYLVNKN